MMAQTSLSGAGEATRVSDEFLTPDMQLSAFLVTLGHSVVRIERDRHPKVFVFRDVPAEDIAAYYRGTRPVRPQPLFQAYRRLKYQLFQPA